MLADGDKGVVLQRDKVSYAVAPHLVCGLADPQTLRKIADVAEKHQLTIKVTSEQRIALIGVPADQVDAVWADLGLPHGHVVGNTVRGVKACPGTDFCKRGQQNSLAMGRILDERYHGIPLPGKMKFGVSGCLFGCAETSFKDIGLIGKPKGWMLVVGGCGGAKARIANPIADGLSDAEALAAVDRLVEFFRQHARPHERMARLVDRLGLETLQAAAVPAQCAAAGR
jgi:NAD(P)H-nitrite reductase large subunit